MISIREEITISAPPEAVWPILSDPAAVAACIPGATLTKSDDNGAYQGTMRVKFGPTVAQFRGEAKLAYDHAARRCSIEGRGIDGRGASRANATGVVEASGTDTTRLRVEGTFNVTGPLETFANAGGGTSPRAPRRVRRERRQADGRAGGRAQVESDDAAPRPAETQRRQDPVAGGGIVGPRDKFSGKETK